LKTQCFRGLFAAWIRSRFGSRKLWGNGSTVPEIVAETARRVYPAGSSAIPGRSLFRSRSNPSAIKSDRMPRAVVRKSADGDDIAALDMARMSASSRGRLASGLKVLPRSTQVLKREASLSWFEQSRQTRRNPGTNSLSAFSERLPRSSFAVCSCHGAQSQQQCALFSDDISASTRGNTRAPKHHNIRDQQQGRRARRKERIY
jgi:hypothetical protein